MRNLSALPGFATTPAAAPTGCPRARLIPLFSRVGVLADTAKLLDALRPPPELISQLERTGSFTWHTVPRPTRQATPGSGTPVTETGLASAATLLPSEWKPSRRPPPSAQNGSAVGTGSPEKSSLHSKCTRTSVWDRDATGRGWGVLCLKNRTASPGTLPAATRSVFLCVSEKYESQLTPTKQTSYVLLSSMKPTILERLDAVGAKWVSARPVSGSNAGFLSSRTNALLMVRF